MADQIFMDCACPHCGSLCGNGGNGDIFYCSVCGWTGKIEMHPDDAKTIQEFIRRAKERDKEATP